MKNTENGQRLILQSETLISEIGSNTPIDSKKDVWNLDHLTLMVTSDTIQDDQKRKEILHKKRRNSNMLLGAIAGGLIDGSEGDDSIVDGVLIGAAFGAIATGSAERPVALVGLIFSDDSFLSMEVSKEEYNALQTIMKRNQQRKDFTASSPVHQKQSLTKEDADKVLSGRGITCAFMMIVMAVLILFASNTLPFVFGDMRADQSGNPLADMSEAMTTVVPWIGNILFFVFAMGGAISMKNLKMHFKSDEESEYYGTVCPEHQASLARKREAEF